jgi:hypothetical protein
MKVKGDKRGNMLKRALIRHFQYDKANTLHGIHKKKKTSFLEVFFNFIYSVILARSDNK